MKYNFCTLFDSYYMSRGLALYYSLEETCDDFHLYIFSFDHRSYEILTGLNLRSATIISLSEFETPDLIKVKPLRTIAEYFWTCTASTIWHAITHYNLGHCVYLDADMLFFSSPEPIFKEIGAKSVAITPHNFSPGYKYSEIYGKFCVQFTFFRNNTAGLKALDWWRKSCIDWCFARMEDGKYGDQKYLDYFSEKFSDVCEISYQGAGVAPWNIDNYELKHENGALKIISRRMDSNVYTLIFYHFQGLKFKSTINKVRAEAYFNKIHPEILRHIYRPYIIRLIKIKNRVTGSNDIYEPVIFYRKLGNILSYDIKSFFKRFRFVRSFYFLMKMKRYSKPKNIGADISIEKNYK